MEQIGFNCQLSLSKIGLTTNWSDRTWFDKKNRTIFPIEIKQIFREEDLAQHVLFDTGRIRTRIRINPVILRQRSCHFRRN